MLQLWSTNLSFATNSSPEETHEMEVALKKHIGCSCGFLMD